MIPVTSRLRRSRPPVPALAAIGLAALLASACSTSGPARQAGVDLAPGTALFAAPPPLADCDRIDVVGLQAFSTAQLPQAHRIVTFADPAKPNRTWTGCVGPGERPSGDAGSQATPEGSTGTQATPEGSTGTKATPEGSTGSVAWLVRYATSEAATRTRPFTNPVTDDGANRTLVRTSSLGDARVRVELSVHADDHSTLVMVTVFDPRTGRNGAECGVVDVPGSAVDDVVTWCLRNVADQLTRPR